MLSIEGPKKFVAGLPDGGRGISKPAEWLAGGGTLLLLGSG